MQVLDSPKSSFSLLNGRLRIQVLNKDPLYEEIVGYYPNGQIHFKNYSGVQGFDGICFAWHDNGVLFEESPYVKGKLEGKVKRWHKNGVLSYEGLHSNNLKEGVHHDFNHIGRIQVEKIYVKGILNGKSREWHINGQIATAENFKEGLLDGLRQEWFLDGQMASDRNYIKGVIHGIAKGWWKNGKIRYQRQFIQGAPEGLLESWDETGLILISENYLRGQRHGKCGMRFKNGALWVEDYFIRGVRVSAKIYGLINSQKLTAQHILKIENATVRKVCLEEFGYARFLSQMPHHILDNEGDQQLIRIKWHKREEDIFLVKVKCPSTGAFYTLRVPPTVETVKEAVAWTFGVAESEYNPDQET